MGVIFQWSVPMSFPARLAQLRKAQGYSQQRLADAVDLHVNQVRRYEAGAAQPTLDALISLARALRVSLDALVFEEGERGPDPELRLQFEAVSQFTPEEKAVAREVLESLILKHTANRFSRPSPARSADSS
jgi:transcriptional regulator with XRE-family HTH domain